MELEFLQRLAKPAETKIVLLVIDGLGGLPLEEGGPTELEAAHTPYLDALTRESICGLHLPVGPGITPGSGPAHQALFGYDPIRYYIGRGALAALGIDFDVRAGDVAARGNFCTIDRDGIISDRRAGRIGSELNRELCKQLHMETLPGFKVFIETVKEYRFLFVLRGEGLSSDVTDTDPEEVGLRPLTSRALSPEAERTAELVQLFTNHARTVLTHQEHANMVLLRGFAGVPHLPRMKDVFGLKGLAIADYPMYRGVARLMGMDILDVNGGFEEKIACVKDRWKDYDFFFIHIKTVDTAGEDGDFSLKVQYIEEVDRKLPSLTDLHPDVLIVTGDHSTPSRLLEHSWHPVPVLLRSPFCRPDRVERFGERDCITGGLGPRLATTDLMPLALANALRLKKFGG